jgi:lipid II:glycine glycyltransferase (peptidoglycan interpeptide bridge formation enzyme)
MPVLDLENPAEVARYETFVNHSPFTQIPQTLGWAVVKNNWEPRYVYLEDEAGNIQAAMSMLLTDTTSGKKFAYASKGPVIAHDDVQALLSLINEAKATLPDAYVLRLDPEWLHTDELVTKLEAQNLIVRGRNIADRGMHGTIQPRLNMVLNIAEYPDAENIFDMVPSKIKNKLRKPEKDGISVDYGVTQDFLDDFFMTYETMSTRQGITHRPKDYFDRMVTAFGPTDMMRIYRAKAAGQTVATSIALKTPGKIWYVYGGSVDSPVSNAPYALQNHMIQWAIDSKTPLYDMGGIGAEDSSDSLWTFKRHFVRTPAREYVGEIDVVLDQAVYAQLVQ